MTTESTIVQTAEFNPKIKTYLLLYNAFVMTVTLIGIPFLIFWFVGLGQYFSRRYYKNLTCKLTDRHLVFRKGVLFKVEKTIPLENIQDITFLENPLLNALELRILKIETAGQSNPQGSDMRLIGIMDSADFKENVLRQREVIKTENWQSSTQPAADQDQVVELLKDIKKLLEDIKSK
ncbi:PH domain-containing protein [Bacteroidota bacterium]